MLILVQPWFENIQKRQVKSPKVYFRDSGLLHYVFGISNYIDIFKHPKAGASFEGFVVEEIIKYSGVPTESCYFWRSHNQAELDLLILKNGKKYGFEIKMSEAPKATSSMYNIIEELHLDDLTIIYPGIRQYNIADNIKVLPIDMIKNITFN